MKGIRKAFIAFVAILLSPVATHAYLISVDARAFIRGGAGEINSFAEIDGAVSALVQADSSEASAFARADLGARTVHTFNDSTTEGFSDAYAEFSDIYYITGVADEVSSVDIGISLSFEGTAVLGGDGEFTAGRLLGRAGQYSVDVSPLTSGGTFANGGIQTFDRLLGGGFNRIDVSMLIDSIALFGVGMVDFSGTGSVEFDLSFLPAGAFLASESGFIILPGDFNGDGKVDGEDFLLWQRDPSVGSLVDWEANYGMVASLSATSAAVPEPTTCGLALAALCLAMSRRRSA